MLGDEDMKTIHASVECNVNKLRALSETIQSIVITHRSEARLSLMCKYGCSRAKKQR